MPKKNIDLSIEAATIAKEMNSVILGTGHFVLAAVNHKEGKKLEKDFQPALQQNYLYAYVEYTYSAENVVTTSATITPFAKSLMEVIRDLIEQGADVLKGTVDYIKNSVDYRRFVENFNLWLEEEEIDVSKKFNKSSYEISKVFEDCDFVTNLNEKVQEDTVTVIGREPELMLLTEALLKKNKANAVLIGEAGVGKTAIVELLAQRINEGNVPAFLKNKVILELNISALVAGTKFRGEFEEKFKKLLKKLEECPNAILFADEFHMIVDAGASSDGSASAANILKPALARGKIKMIGATTYDEYRKFVEEDKAFERRFERIDVKEPNEFTVREILKGVRPSYEEFHGLKITDESLDAILTYTKKYMASRHFPDKALDILDSTCVSCRMAEQTVVLPENIIKTVEKKTGVRIVKTAEVNFEEKLKEIIKGQDEAVKGVADTLEMIDLGLVDDNKPMSVMMFAGPTGVGKTELAKQLAKTYFGSEDKMVRVDMGEYSNSGDASKILGSAPGYVGYDKESNLISGVRKEPYSVVLLDEIEKAHPSVLETLLQMLDEGFMTSSQGVLVDFRHTIVIMTSNVGFHNTDGKAISFLNTKEKENNNIMNALKENFTPEFLNRIDKTIIFNRLDKTVIKDIANNYAKTFGDFTITDEDIEEIAQKTNIDEQGARAVKRIVRSEILPKKIKKKRAEII